MGTIGIARAFIYGGGEEERFIDRLQSDRIGVIVDALVKHEKIKCIDEIYESRIFKPTL